MFCFIYYFSVFYLYVGSVVEEYSFNVGVVVVVCVVCWIGGVVDEERSLFFVLYFLVCRLVFDNDDVVFF